MNIEEFARLTKGETFDLYKRKSESGTNSTWLFNHILEKIQYMILDNCNKDEIKVQVEKILEPYIVMTDESDSKAREIMKKWGMKFDES